MLHWSTLLLHWSTLLVSWSSELPLQKRTYDDGEHCVAGNKEGVFSDLLEEYKETAAQDERERKRERERTYLRLTKKKGKERQQERRARENEETGGP